MRFFALSKTIQKHHANDTCYKCIQLVILLPCKDLSYLLFLSLWMIMMMMMVMVTCKDTVSLVCLHPPQITTLLSCSNDIGATNLGCMVKNRYFQFRWYCCQWLKIKHIRARWPKANIKQVHAMMQHLPLQNIRGNPTFFPYTSCQSNVPLWISG